MADHFHLAGNRHRTRLAFAFLCVVVNFWMTANLHADVSLPAILSDNMVVQLGQEIQFWGSAEPNEEVTVVVTPIESGNDSKPDSASAMAAADGRWLVKLPAKTKPGPLGITVSGKNTITLTNVIVGDVWLCSGQSNMEWPVNATQNHQEEIAAAKFPTLRLFKLERNTSLTPSTHLEGKWVECTPETIPDFSGVGYFFGRELHGQLKRPIGLIQAASGGASCEAWTSLAVLKSDELFAPILARAERANSDPNQANNPNRASVLYNGMIAPLLPFPIRGVIWYQGESNAPRAFQYAKLFPAMITDWRKGWKKPELPFLFVQLANYVSDKQKPDHSAEPEESAWAELREAQSKALSLPRTGMACTIDIGDARDINPRNKQDVGRRLAQVALKVAYGKKIVASGPTFKSIQVNGNEVRIEFDNVGEGLIVRGERLTGFAIAGEDKRFVWADATVDGNVVSLTSPYIAEPLAVRYAWGDNPDCNLFNREGLPAVPFRTDDWTSVTKQSR